MTQATPTHDGLPGHGPLPEQSGTDARRSDPRGTGAGGQDRDTLRLPGGMETAVDPAAGTHPQSEFRAFLDDVSMLVRGRPMGFGSGAGATSALRDRIERQVEGARSSLSQVVGRAQDAGTELGDELQGRIEDARDLVIERPIAAVSVAAFAGLVIGLAISRRR